MERGAGRGLRGTSSPGSQPRSRPVVFTPSGWGVPGPDRPEQVSVSRSQPSQRV